jgi:cytochrome oxidase assembly protein ShyY1
MIEPIQLNSPYDLLNSLPAYIDTTPGLDPHTVHAVEAPKENDTVTLSASAQANQLYLQGNNISQIAALLGIPPATVATDLNISQDSSPSTPVVQATTAQSPATQVTPADASTPYKAASSPYTAATIAYAA